MLNRVPPQWPYFSCLVDLVLLWKSVNISSWLMFFFIWKQFPTLQNQTVRNLPAPLDHDERPDKGKRKAKKERWYIPQKKTHKIYSQSYCKRKEKKDHILTQSPICPHINTHHIIKTLPKAQRTRGLSSAHQSNFFRSYHKFSNKSWLDFIFIISTKQQLQNISQISAFRLILNFKILTKRSLRISTKNNLHNLNQGSAATSASKSCLRTSKFWPNLVLEVWTKKWFYDQTSAAESVDTSYQSYITRICCCTGK